MSDETVNPGRRTILKLAGATAVTSAFSSALADDNAGSIRWGIVGTGMIANIMVNNIHAAEGASVAAVSSRSLESATEFASKHGVPHAFDSWSDMIASDEVDAIYVATPTSVREEICVAAANGGKHVLGEKPFANLESLQRITAACRDNGVSFMDGTHFVHHPRTEHIRSALPEKTGKPWTIASAFQFGLSGTDNIRFNPKLEPYGAIGDAGWYNMRAAVEFISPDAKLVGAEAYARRSANNAVVTAAGVVAFDDGCTSTWSCGFEAGAVSMFLSLAGAKGEICLTDFVSERGGGTADYDFRTGSVRAEPEHIEIPSPKNAGVLMIEDFTTMVGDESRFAASVRASERTQELVDAIWRSANSR